jgi:toxin secretion/phage lysis holin
LKENTFKALFAVAIGGLAAYFREVAIPLIILIVVMIIDYISGMAKAWIKAELSSKVGLKGIIKKICYLLVVCVAAVVDWLITSGLQKVGINITVNYLIGVIVTIWLIINELISILENLSVVGVPLPPFLSAVVHKLKISVENSTEPEKESEKA